MTEMTGNCFSIEKQRRT